MQKKLLQFLLVAGGLIMVIRFGSPALINGTTGPGPLGRTWVDNPDSMSLLLDADLRFLGTLIIGNGVILFWMSLRPENHTVLIRIMSAAIFAGGLVRIVAFFEIGNPGIGGIIPVFIELTLPVAVVVLQEVVRKRRST